MFIILQEWIVLITNIFSYTSVSLLTSSFYWIIRLPFSILKGSYKPVISQNLGLQNFLECIDLPFHWVLQMENLKSDTFHFPFVVVGFGRGGGLFCFFVGFGLVWFFKTGFLCIGWPQTQRSNYSQEMTFLFFFGGFSDTTVFLCGIPGCHFVVQAGLELTKFHLPLPYWRIAGIKGMPTTASFQSIKSSFSIHQKGFVNFATLNSCWMWVLTANISQVLVIEMFLFPVFRWRNNIMSSPCVSSLLVIFSE